MRTTIAVVLVVLGGALTACADSGGRAPAPSEPPTAWAARTPLALEDRLVGPADGLEVCGSSTTPVVPEGQLVTTPALCLPFPLDETRLRLYLTPARRSMVVEGLSTIAGGLVLRTGSPAVAAGLVRAAVARLRRAGGTMTELDGVPGGRLVARAGLTTALFGVSCRCRGSAPHEFRRRAALPEKLAERRRPARRAGSRSR